MAVVDLRWGSFWRNEVVDCLSAMDFLLNRRKISKTRNSKISAVVGNKSGLRPPNTFKILKLEEDSHSRQSSSSDLAINTQHSWYHSLLIRERLRSHRRSRKTAFSTGISQLWTCFGASNCSLKRLCVCKQFPRSHHRRRRKGFPSFGSNNNTLIQSSSLQENDHDLLEAVLKRN